jgi:putrescine---pyruvate transaminase
MASTDWSDIQRSDLSHLWHPWTPALDANAFPLPLYVRGEGCYVFDSVGRKYLDARSAALNASLGYGRKDIADAISEQMLKLMTFELAGSSTIPPVQLAAKMAELLPPPLRRTFFCSSGSEATETSIKMVRMYHRLRGDKSRNLILGFNAGYHGATWGALALSNSRFNQEGYDPAAQGFIAVGHPSNNTKNMVLADEAIRWVQLAIEKVSAERVAAVMIEPVLGIGGIRIPPDNYLRLLRELCDRHGILLVFDEILTGFGRTGRMFAFEHWNVLPDIILSSKCLTGGYIPLSAVTTTEDIYSAFVKDPLLGGFRHGHTNSGHASACAGALAVVNAIEREHLVQNSAEKGKILIEKLRSLTTGHPAIVDVRGLGLLIAIEFNENDAGDHLAMHFANYAAREGLIVRQQEEIVTIAPPLIISTAECDLLVEIAERVLAKMAR